MTQKKDTVLTYCAKTKYGYACLDDIGLLYYSPSPRNAIEVTPDRTNFLDTTIPESYRLLPWKDGFSKTYYQYVYPLKTGFYIYLHQQLVKSFNKKNVKIGKQSIPMTPYLKKYLIENIY